MTLSLAERHRLAIFGWLATVGTSIALFPATEEKRYVLLGAGLSALVVAIGMGLRQLHVPTLLVPLVQALVAGELLLLGYGGHTTYRIVPTAESFSHLQAVWSSGVDVAQRYAAPVPPSAGVMLMMVSFVTLIAILVDVLAAGLARAPLAGLPLLALYAVPVASLPDGVPAVGFIPGAIGYVALLMVCERERLAHWGRHVARTTHLKHSEVVDTSGLKATGRRISLVAISTAVVLPILIPTFSSGLFTNGNGLGDGSGNVNFTDPMVSLATALHRRSPVDYMLVTSDVEPSYLRLAVLDDPGPNAWRNSGVDLSLSRPAEDTSLPDPFGRGPDVSYLTKSMNVQLTADFPAEDAVWLPVPDALKSLTFAGFPGEFAFLPDDSTVTSRGEDQLSHVTSYFAQYQITTPTEAQLRNASSAPLSVVSRFGSVPDGVPELVGQVARSVTAGYRTDYDKALALQSYFRDRDNFTYDLDAGYGDGYRAMATFLHVRKGYCQHFASTMAMMARELGIPSRVVVGFLQPSGTRVGDYVFSSDDAHAWPELYFGGIGWVRFEPTPGNGATIPPYTHIVAPGIVTPTKSNPSTNRASPGGGRNTDEFLTTTPTQGESNAGPGGGGDSSLPSVWWLAAIALLVLALAPGGIRWSVRRSRLARAVDGGPSSEFAWIELRDRIRDLRQPWTGSLTPRARSRFVEPLLGGDGVGIAALDRLSLTVERARYASTPLPDAQPAEDARQVMAAITAEVSTKARVLAFVWPASLMPELRTSWAGIKARLGRRPRPSEA